MTSKLKGCLCLLLGTVIWGSAFIAQSVGMDLIGPFTFQAIRCGLAVLFLIPTTFILDIRKYKLSESIAKWQNPALWQTGGLCGIALFVATSLQQIGLIFTEAGKAGFITAMYIVIVPVLGLFLGRKPRKIVYLSVLIAVAGLYLLSCAGAFGIEIGDLCLIGCAIAFAVQITLIDRFAGSIDGIRLNCIQALTVTVLSVPFALFTESIVYANIAACWLPLFFAGVLSMGVAYTLQIAGQKRLEPTAAALIMSMESVFAALGGCMILEEQMTELELGGCLLVFLAVILSQLPEKK